VVQRAGLAAVGLGCVGDGVVDGDTLAVGEDGEAVGDPLGDAVDPVVALSVPPQPVRARATSVSPATTRPREEIRFTPRVSARVDPIPASDAACWVPLEET
jgi:hypothetical protein